MQLEPGMLEQPRLDRWGLVGGEVVEDDVHIQVGGHVLIDGAQKRQELLMAVAPCHCADHLASGDLQGSEEAGGAVADIVEALTFGHGASSRPSPSSPPRSPS